MRAASSLLLLIAFSFALLAADPCFAANASTEVPAAFDSANKLYEQGKFVDAANAYESLIQSGTSSPALYFNFGNALFKAGQTGRAITAYRQAEQLAPRDPDLRANLQFARNQVQGPTFLPGRWERWLGKLSLNEWTWATVVAVWLTFLLLAVAQLRPQAKPSLRNWAILAGAAALVFGACLGCALAHGKSVRMAIVTQKDITVRNGPLDDSPALFTAHDGAELRVLDSKDDWLQVTAGQRRIGWLKRSAVTFADRS